MVSDSLVSLFSWLDSSPTPFHVVQTARERLKSSGFLLQTSFTEPLATQGYFSVDGAIIAWTLGDKESPIRIVGAHTDSPNFRVQPQPDVHSSGWSQVGVEIYGGVLVNSWLDRDLGIAGRVIDNNGFETLFNVDTPLARIPQLAIHLDRDVNEKGVLLDRHQHTVPVWGVKTPLFLEWLAEISGVTNVVAFDAHLHDVQKASILGVDSSLIASGRLDNQLSCWAAINSLVDNNSSHTCIAILNDHEEVGSESVTGAAGPLLETFIRVLADQHGLTHGQLHGLLSTSWCLSADNAHAVHPNYRERHESKHAPLPNQGVALKLNGNQRYATSARGAAFLRSVAESHDIPLQTFVSRNNMPCGSTIGPITATKLGIEAIDVGVPQLSMHSAREMCGADDPQNLVNLMTAFYRS